MVEESEFMRITAGNLGRLGLSSLLCLGLVTGAGLSAAVAEEIPPASVFEPGSEAAAQEAATTTGQDVVVDDATTPTGVSVARPDGTFSRTEHVEPVRMETNTGWQDISTDLVSVKEDGKTVLKPEMVPVEVTLGSAGTDEMAVLDDGQGHSITQSWPFGVLPSPVVVDNTATYPGVLPGVDLIQIVHPTGVSQVLRIATAEAARDPRVASMRIFLDAQNATVTATGDGGLQAKGIDSGQVELRTAAGQWWDSSQEGASATDPGNPGLTWPFNLTMGKEGGQDTQVFGMDEILGRTGVVYPIYVDPDWTFPRANYVYVDSGYPTMSYWNGQYTLQTGHVGFLPASDPNGDGQDHVTRTFFNFSTSFSTGKVILSARMNTQLTWSASCSATPVSAWQVGPISSSTTWNNKPALQRKASTQTISKGRDDCVPANSDGPVAFDLTALKTELPKYTSMTIGLLADNETDPRAWKIFSNNPTLVVTYGTPPATPTIYTITGGLWHGTAWAAGSTYVTRFSKPTYTVRASDPDGVNGGTITVNMRVKKSGASTYLQTGTTPAGSAAAGTMFNLPSSIDLGNGAYVLEAQTKDQQGLLSGWMSFNFTVDITAPPAPAITAVTASLKNSANTDPNGVLGQTAYTLSITKGADTPTKKSYDIDAVIYAVSGTTISTHPVEPMLCNARKGIFVKVCGSTVSITVAAIDQTTNVAAWAFDKAGNASTEVMSGSTTPGRYSFHVNGPANPLPSTSLPLTMHGGAALVDINAPSGKPTPGECPAVVDPDGDPSGVAKALRLSGPGDYASTASGGVNTATSYSIGLWVCNTGGKTSTLARHIITQIAGTGSPGAAIRLTPTGAVEAAQWTGASGTGLGARPTSSDLATNHWYYVAVVSDKINGQLRISVNDDGLVSTWITTEGATLGRTAVNTQPVLLGYSGLVGDGKFVGEIFNPVMTNSVLSMTQFTTLRQQVEVTGAVRK